MEQNRFCLPTPKDEDDVARDLLQKNKGSKKVGTGKRSFFFMFAKDLSSYNIP